MYYPSSENKGTDQLRSYCEADLRLCFRLCRLLVFPCGGSIICDNSFQHAEEVKNAQYKMVYKVIVELCCLFDITLTYFLTPLEVFLLLETSMSDKDVCS